MSTGISHLHLPEILTSAQEGELCRQIEAGLLASAVLDDQAEWPLDASREELETLAAEGRAAWQCFIEANLRLVTHLSVDSARRSGLSAEEFFQEGCVALAEALRRFDHRQGTKFSTYAFPWVRNAMHQVMMRRGGALDGPLWHARQARQLRERRGMLEAERGGMVSLAELAHVVGRSTEWVQLMLTGDQLRASIDEIGEMACPGAMRAMEECEQSLPGWLRELGSQEAVVLRLRYGLDDGVERTYADCAQRLNLSPSTVRRLERRGLARAREVLVDEPLAA